eukprot:247942_1
MAYYVSFLKALSLKLNENSLHFFFNVLANDFPLYTEAIKLFKHGEKMVRIAVRIITLNVYKVEDADLRKFILDKSAVPFFFNLVWFIRDQCIALDLQIPSITYFDKNLLTQLFDDQLDNYFYLEDIMTLGINKLASVLMDQILCHFVIPVLIGSILASSSPSPEGTYNRVGTKFALFLLSQLFDIFSYEPFVTSIATCLIDPHPLRVIEQMSYIPLEKAISRDTNLSQLLVPFNGVPASPVGKSPTSKNAMGLKDALLKINPDKPVDLNIENPRSLIQTVEEVAPVDRGSLMRCDQNSFRNNLFECLSSQDEQLVYFAACVFLTMIKNSSVNREVLQLGRICPQRTRRTARLFGSLVRRESFSSAASRSSAADFNENKMEKIAASAELRDEVRSDSPSFPPSEPIVDSEKQPKHSEKQLEHSEKQSEHSEKQPGHSEKQLGHSEKQSMSELRETETENLGEHSQLSNSDVSPKIESPQSSEHSQILNNDFESTIDATKSPEDVVSVSTDIEIDMKADNELENENKLDSDSSTIESTICPPEVISEQRLKQPEEPDRQPEQPEKQQISEASAKQSKLEVCEEQQTPETTEFPANRFENPEETESPKSISSEEAAGLRTLPPISIPVISSGKNDDEWLYPTEIVDGILVVLNRSPKPCLVTLVILSELLIEVVLDKSTRIPLSPGHCLMLEEAFRSSIANLRPKLSGPLGGLFLDTFEEEWRMLCRPTNVRQIISNPVTLLPVATNAISGVSLEYRQPAGLLEQTRRSIEVFLILRSLYKTLACRGEEDEGFPFVLPEDYKIKPKGDFEIDGQQDLLECQLVQKRWKLRVYLVIDPQWFLLVIPNQQRAGWSIVEVAFPLHNQQASTHQRDNSLMVVKIRSEIKPHSSCAMEQGTYEKPLWLLHLTFADALHCMTAVKQLETQRLALRTKMMSRLDELVLLTGPNSEFTDEKMSGD